ncbi:MAG: DUF1499 domain-containing protein [Alphaproteobacteria bacterium]
MAGLLAGCLKVPDSEKIDFTTLVPPDRPNWALACPPEECAGLAGTATPIMPLTPDRLAALADEVIRAGPDVAFLGRVPDRLQYHYVQRSRFFGFPDLVTFEAVPVAGGAGFYLYSRSVYGYGDLGVNRQRVQDLVGRIAARAGQK